MKDCTCIESLASQMLSPAPVAWMSRKTRALIPIRISEVSCGLPDLRPPYAVRPDRVVLAPSAMQFGHWKPTAASRMQSGQIGRSQRWQRM